MKLDLSRNLKQYKDLKCCVCEGKANLISLCCGRAYCVEDFLQSHLVVVNKVNKSDQAN